MAIWPASLPQHWLISGMNERSDKNAVIHTQMESGPRMSRQRYDADIRPFSAMIFLDGLQRTVFDTFWTSTIKRGSLPFEWYDPANGAALDVKLLDWTIDPFVGSPGASTHKKWKLTMNLESVP